MTQANRVYVKTPTLGQGTVTLGAVVSKAFCTPAEAGVTDGASIESYIIEAGQDFEIGVGIYNSEGPTLTRATVRLSKIDGVVGTTKMTLIGNATVRVIMAAEDLLDLVTDAGLQEALYTKQNAISPRLFGGIGDGVTDDTEAVQAAVDEAALGVGAVDLSGGRWLIDSADLNISEGVFVLGPWLNLGEQSSLDWSNIKSSIILNPAYTIRLNGDFSGLRGLGIFRKGLTQATTVREGVTAVAAFAGTAVTVGTGVGKSANDSYFGHCLVLGFDTLYSNYDNERPRVEYISGDCVNGIKNARVFDMNHLSHCHLWPFVTCRLNPVGYAVTGASDNGAGLVRLTFASHGFVVGDVIPVKSVTGTTEANGRWTVATATATTIDLAGSTFAHAWVSGGTAYLSAWRRTGKAYWFDGTSGPVDWGQIDNCFAYGYDTGFKIDSSDYTTFVNCGADNYATLGDPTPVGWDVTGTCKAAALIGCKAAAHGINFKINLTGGITESAALMQGCRSWGAVSRLYSLEAGRVTLTGCHGQTGGTLYVGPSIGYVKMLGGDFGGVTFNIDSAALPLVDRLLVGGVANMLNSSLNIGASYTDSLLAVDKPFQPSTNAFGFRFLSTISASSTGSIIVSQSAPSTAAASFTLAALTHYIAQQNVIGAGSAITTQRGFHASSSLVSAGTNQGFYGDIAAGTNRWNLYMNGTARNYLAGGLSLGSAALTVDPGAGGLAAAGSIVSISPTAGIGYATGAGGTVAQATSRTTGVTINKVCGAIALVSAAGSAAAASFTVTNSAVAATDTITLSQKSGTDRYVLMVTKVAAGSFEITFFTTGGTTVEQPVINFNVIKGVTA